jgi:SAM-dependent methyltransferase
MSNATPYDGIVDAYDEIHGEIFNPIEQNRLRDQLNKAKQWIQSSTTTPLAMDFGCGSGNLTSHLLEIGFQVVSADVSRKFLQFVESRFGGSGRVKTLHLNGRDLSNVSDGAFDCVASYSVLHHIPDYRAILREYARVIRPGGIIYIDHEHSDGFWRADDTYREFVSIVEPPPKKHWKRFFILTNYLHLIRLKLNPRYKPEGDIHVWPDDHIEWPTVASILTEAGCEIVHQQDYLLFKRGYSADVYGAFEGRCHDMHMLVARKL